MTAASKQKSRALAAGTTKNPMQTGLAACMGFSGKGRLIDLHRDLGVLPHSSGPHHGAHGLGNTALFTDDAAHVVRRHMQMENDDPVLVRLILDNHYSVGILHQTFGEDVYKRQICRTFSG